MLPTTPHDWALWLFDELEGVQNCGDGLWQGALPKQFEFSQIAGEINALGRLGGVHDESSRRIEFYPFAAHVYPTISALLLKNPGHIPARFTTRDLSYTHGVTTPVPETIRAYEASVQLWGLLTLFVDHVGNNGTLLYFIKTHDARLEVSLEYGVQDIVALPSLCQFQFDFVASSLHADQKKSIFRATLLDLFKGRPRAPFSEVIRQFEVFAQNVRSAYAMYASEFSYEKVRAEVEKDNLDSMLKLNKTFSEIQNQLLALPVALVLVAGQMTAGSELTLKNFVLWAGALLFSILMWLLVHNQRNEVMAIEEEIDFRWQKIEKQPLAIKERFEGSFKSLRKRKNKQDVLLKFLNYIVVVSLASSTLALYWHSTRPGSAGIVSTLPAGTSSSKATASDSK